MKLEKKKKSLALHEKRTSRTFIVAWNEESKMILVRNDEDKNINESLFSSFLESFSMSFFRIWGQISLKVIMYISHGSLVWGTVGGVAATCLSSVWQWLFGLPRNQVCVYLQVDTCPQSGKSVPGELWDTYTPGLSSAPTGTSLLFVEFGRWFPSGRTRRLLQWTLSIGHLLHVTVSVPEQLWGERIKIINVIV